jgi:hypothetical protein
MNLAGSLLGTILVALPALWCGMALWYQAPGDAASKIFSVAVWAAFAAGVITALWVGRAALGLAAFAVAFVALLVWWESLAPSNDRVWADDVARIMTGTVDGNRVVLHEVRNFDWRTDTDYSARWETRTYDLSKLESVDMIMSYWKWPSIAHMLISFGFDGGDHVAFSVEIRRERDEVYSELGGFFKEFELSIIAADERDVVRLRTNVRREDAYLYRLRLPPGDMRALFLSYVGEANGLKDTPRWYNTITVNCTMLVYHMMKRIVGHLPLSYQLLFSGYLPEYVYAVGGFDRRYSLEELRRRGRITERARQYDRSANFSADIRAGVPGYEAGDHSGSAQSSR